MAKHFVNLDALIPREDFEASPNKFEQAELAGTLKIVELENDSILFKLLRKPDFQRTTAHWEPEKVTGFIKSFLAGDLIPAIIMWRSTVNGNIFVIDGAHRLSALLAWVHDDYGDKQISIPFFENFIPVEQTKAAEETRKLVRETTGSYSEIKYAMKNPSGIIGEKALYASNLGTLGIKLQWVPGDASRAEKSFHTINTQQTPIGEIEMRMIRDRRCPNTLATRSLIRAGTGNTYVSTFPNANKEQIKTFSKEVYDDIFVPPLDTPIKTLDLPVAGRGYSSDAIKMILDFVEFVNKPETEDPLKTSKRSSKPDILIPTMEEDRDGSATIDFLKNVRRVSSLIAGTQPKSLGLHPAVYFYSATGIYQPAAFLAAVKFAQEIESTDKLILFTDNRKNFEEILINYKHLINHIVRKFGGGHRSLNAIYKLYRHIFDGVIKNISEDKILPGLADEEQLAFLKNIIDDNKNRPEFSSERKSAVYLRTALKDAPQCAICHARVHKKSITIDHIKPKSEGGRGDEDNGQLTHPYCNTGYKEAKRALESKH